MDNVLVPLMLLSGLSDAPPAHSAPSHQVTGALRGILAVLTPRALRLATFDHLTSETPWPRSARFASQSLPVPSSRSGRLPRERSTVAPRNSTRNWGLKEGRNGAAFASTIRWCPPHQPRSPRTRTFCGS